MNVQELTRYGVRQSLVDLWRDCGHETLLPVQRLAVQRCDLFRGESLIVSAPTSSGKTFIGEMAAAHVAVDARRCFYLVPLKALASEKFETFRERYGRHGLRVVASTRDYRYFDTAIERGRFDFAVVVYEKMQQLLTRKPDLLDGVGLVVADELQVLADADRGAGIEVLLTRLKLAGKDLQFVGLSAVLKNSDVLSHWLGASFLEHHERPVELRRGILFDGAFEYETYNTHQQGTEPLIHVEEEPAWYIIMANAVELAQRGEQSLIFLSDKNSTRQMATLAAEEFQGPPATEAIDELTALEETLSRQMLIDSLQSGIAFHNADLSLAERRTIEKHYRAGHIRIICATPTLAVGVNLPAKNVFLEPMLWERSRENGCVHRRYLTRAEYENMGGRAGRLSLHDNFGRSILVATTPFEKMQLQSLYFEAPLGELEPQLVGVDLDTHVMNLVASGAAHTAAHIERFLTHTLTGVVHRQSLAEHREKFRAKVQQAVANCLEFGVVEEAGGALRSTSLGRLSAIKGVTARTGYEIRSWLASLRGRSFNEAEAVYVLCRTPEARDQHLNMSTEEYRAWVYPDQLLALLHPQSVPFFGRTFESRNYQMYEEVKPMKMALVVHEWALGRPAIDIEQQYQSLAGTIRNAAEVCSWLADAAAAIADLLQLPEERVGFLRDLTSRLDMGVSQAGVALCGLRVRGFGRTYVTKLLRAGLTTPEEVRDAPAAELTRILGSKMAERVRGLLERRQQRGASSPEPTRPPSDAPRVSPKGSKENGGAGGFLCPFRLHFDGTPVKRRTVIRVDRRRHEIPNKAFAILLYMARQVQADGTGWVRKEKLGRNPQQTVSHIRKDLRAILPDPDVDILENDGFGAYRLSVSPENMTFDWEQIRRHWDAKISRQAPRTNTAPAETPSGGSPDLAAAAELRSHA